MVHGTTVRPVDFTRVDLDAVITDALSKVPDDRWTKAIYRAAANLAAGMFSFDGEHVILRSASSSKAYRISTREPMACSCKAHERGLRCWHVVAARLLVRAAERHARQNDGVYNNVVSPLDAHHNSDVVNITVSPLDARQNNPRDPSTVSPLDARQNDDRVPNVVPPMAAFASLTSATNAELFG